MLARLDDVPPLIAYGRARGWQPLPLTVRDGRRSAGELLTPRPPPSPARRGGVGTTTAASPSPRGRVLGGGRGDAVTPGPALLATEALTFRYGQRARSATSRSPATQARWSR